MVRYYHFKPYQLKLQQIPTKRERELWRKRKEKRLVLKGMREREGGKRGRE